MSKAHKIACGLLTVGLGVCIYVIFSDTFKNTPIAPPNKATTIPTDSININNISIRNIVYPQNDKKQKEDTLSTKVIKEKSDVTQKNNVSTNRPNTKTK